MFWVQQGDGMKWEPYHHSYASNYGVYTIKALEAWHLGCRMDLPEYHQKLVCPVSVFASSWCLKAHNLAPQVSYINLSTWIYLYIIDIYNPVIPLCWEYPTITNKRPCWEYLEKSARLNADAKVAPDNLSMAWSVIECFCTEFGHILSYYG